MSAIWDSDTGHVTITAAKNGAAVNLSGTTERTIIVRHVKSGVATILDEVDASSDLPAGVVVADGGPLTPGRYQVVIRCVDATRTETYPSADQPAQYITVLADLDATP